jgi:uncharacterized protein YkwD
VPFSKHLRLAFGLVFAVLALVLAPTSQAGATEAESELALVAAVNDVREAHNLRPLRVDADLARAARAHSTTLIQTNVFEHGSFAARIARYGARGPVFGENLAWGTGRLASAWSIFGAWMDSPGHRANLLRPGWSRIGIGARSGRFLGYGGALVVTADFAGL